MPKCVQCGRELTIPPRGRRPRYCSRACQARAHRERVRARAEAGGSGARQGGGPVAADTGAAPPEQEPAEEGSADSPRAGSTLSREVIVRAAVRIADTEGLEALSMRHIARELDANVMSLYHYIDGKDELIDLMVETVFSEDTEGAEETAPRSWRAELEASARWEWSLYSTHPWVLEVIATVQPPLVPGVLAGVERGLGALDGLGLDPATAHRVYLSLSGLIQGLALLRVSEIATDRRGGVPLSQWRAVKVPAVLEELGTENYPRQAALRNNPDEIADLEEIFEFGLRRLLDGFAVFVDGRAARSPDEPPLGGALGRDRW
ncbi:TetR/AcrR family transcriptional regulator C-terminal domain-containing protein [Nocardiopsis mangrovi]|uniref:TetR/AcrR family transcriptional regulator C-terminal domain-containing protein n=1 Tax=Nocardiopsis mangrovi TaxID=1179818 RepID=A0ABV9DZ91_9ACTN